MAVNAWWRFIVAMLCALVLFVFAGLVFGFLWGGCCPAPKVVRIPTPAKLCKLPKLPESLPVTRLAKCDKPAVLCFDAAAAQRLVLNEQAKRDWIKRAIIQCGKKTP